MMIHPGNLVTILDKDQNQQKDPIRELIYSYRKTL